jgi:outer membrane protein assembly factor BamB
MIETMNDASRRPRRTWARVLMLPFLVAGLAGCGTLGIGGEKKDKGTPTVGNRQPILSRIAGEVKADPALASVSVVLPPARTNAEWPQAGGNAAKAPGHLTLGATPAQAWTARIPGSNPRRRLASAPVVGAGSLFVVDTDGMVHAFDAATGGRRWAHPIEVQRDLRNSAFGGGVSFADGKV